MKYPSATKENVTPDSPKKPKESELTLSEHLELNQKDIDRIPKLVLPDAGQSIDGDSLRNLRKSGVYILMKGETVLYVGLGTSLLGRLAGTNHKQSDKAIAQCDKVLMYPCVSAEAANELETILITRLQPVHNWNKKWVHHLQMLGVGGRPEQFRQRYAPDLPTRAEFMNESGDRITIKKCKDGCCTMEYSLGKGKFAFSTCKMNQHGQLKSSREDFLLAWDHNRCVICGHPLADYFPEAGSPRSSKR